MLRLPGMAISEPTRVGTTVLRTITLAADEVATISFRRAPNDDQPVSWILKPAAGASITVEYSLRPEGDEAWHEHNDSPFTDDAADSERNPVARLRFTASGGGAVVDVLSARHRDLPISEVDDLTITE